METFVSLMHELWEVWKEMWHSFMEVAPKFLSFVLWVLCAVVILPCVFVAGNLYPLWQEWGEDL